MSQKKAYLQQAIAAATTIEPEESFKMRPFFTRKRYTRK
jgi:hypothetical protein